MRMTFRTLGVALATATLSVTVATAAAAAQTELLVYSAIEADQLKAYKEAFEKDNPDIAIRWVRDSTGIVTAKLLAEKAKGSSYCLAALELEGHKTAAGSLVYHRRKKEVGFLTSAAWSPTAKKTPKPSAGQRRPWRGRSWRRSTR